MHAAEAEKPATLEAGDREPAGGAAPITRRAGETPSGAPSPASVLSELAAHPRGDDLARLVHAVAFAAADEQRGSLSDGLGELLARLELTEADTKTPHGDVAALLATGGPASAPAPERRAAAVLLGVLLARGVALSPPASPEAEARVAHTLLWLASRTRLDAFPALDAALGPRADPLWRATGDALRRFEEGPGPARESVDRAGAFVAAAALAGSRSHVARAEASALAAESTDPVVHLLLRAAAGSAQAAEGPGPGAEGSTVLTGELAPRPRGPLATALLALSGLLFVARGARLVAELGLRYRSPAELVASPRGVTVMARTELLGRTLREHRTHYPVASLARASREVRYPRLGLYVGLFSLALGTYLGVSLFIDGARAGSPELLGLGALVVAAGLALDYFLSHLRASSRGRCRVVVVPRRGAPLAIAKLDPARADDALSRLGGG